MLKRWTGDQHCIHPQICNVTVCPSWLPVASSGDFLMSDGEEDGSFLSLPGTTFAQCPSLTADLTETSPHNQQLLIQVGYKEHTHIYTRIHTHTDRSMGRHSCRRCRRQHFFAFVCDSKRFFFLLHSFVRLCEWTSWSDARMTVSMLTQMLTSAIHTMILADRNTTCPLQPGLAH